MPSTHPPYAPEYRRRIIELARAGRSINQLAREFEPSAFKRNGDSSGTAILSIFVPHFLLDNIQV